MGKLNKIAKNVGYHLADSTAIIAESTPIFAGFEVGIAGMPKEASENARMFAAKLAFCGAGWVYGKGRNLGRKLFHITDYSSEKAQAVYDMAYAAAFNLALSIPVYRFICDVKDWKQIAIGTGCAATFGAVNGGPLGYAIGAFRDMVGLEECNRKSYPDLIKQRSPLVKKGIAAGLVAALLGLTGLIYSFAPDQS